MKEVKGSFGEVSLQTRAIDFLLFWAIRRNFQLTCIHIGSFAQDLDHIFFNQELKRFDTAICALHLKAPHAVTRASLSSFKHRVNSAASLLVLGN